MDMEQFYTNPMKIKYKHFVSIKSSTYYISSRFSKNSEADASEFLENLEEMFPFCIPAFKFSNTQQSVDNREVIGS